MQQRTQNTGYLTGDKYCAIQLHNSLEKVEESVIAKSTGEQEEEDVAPQDAAFFHYLATGKKISKEEAFSILTL